MSSSSTASFMMPSSSPYDQATYEQQSSVQHGPHHIILDKPVSCDNGMCIDWLVQSHGCSKLLHR